MSCPQKSPLRLVSFVSPTVVHAVRKVRFNIGILYGLRDQQLLKQLASHMVTQCLCYDF